MKVIHPDLTFYTNYDEITRIVAKALDDFAMADGLSWYTDQPFLFSCNPTAFHFTIENPATGLENKEKGAEYAAKLGQMLSFEPKVLNGCPVCRTVRILDALSKDRVGDVCGRCHEARTFNMHVTCREDVTNFCDHYRFKLPSTYGGL